MNGFFIAMNERMKELLYLQMVAQMLRPGYKDAPKDIPIIQNMKLRRENRCNGYGKARTRLSLVCSFAHLQSDAFKILDFEGKS